MFVGEKIKIGNEVEVLAIRPAQGGGYVILGQNPNGPFGEIEYTVHIYSPEHQAFYSGEYTTSWERALCDFNARK